MRSVGSHVSGQGLPVFGSTPSQRTRYSYSPLVSGFVFFSLSTGKRAAYLLPLYPAAAMLVGWMWARAMAAGERSGYSNYSYWRSTLQVFFKNKVAVFLLCVLAALKSESHIKALNRVFGTLFVAAGMLLATFKRAT